MRQQAAHSQLWVIGPADAAAVATRLAGEEYDWCVLGTRVATRERVARHLAWGRCVQIGTGLNHLAHEIRQPFLDWIAAIGMQQRDQRVWWSTKLASRSPWQTDLFLLVCYDQLVRRWVNERPAVRRRVVVVEDPWLLLVIRRRWAKDARIDVLGSGGRTRLMDAAYQIGKIPFSVGDTLRWSLWLMVLAKRWFPEKTRGTSEAGRSPTHLLYTWVDEGCFTVPGRFQDRCTGRLEEVLRRGGARVKRLTSLKMSIGCLRQLRAYASDVMVTPGFLRVVDIGRALGTWARIDRLRQVSRFEGCEYAPLLYRELLREWGDPGFALYQLYDRAMRRLARRCAATVKLVIYPFENQPWEKMMVGAFREEAPTVRLVGYQHSSVTTLELNYFLGAGEHARIPLPDQVVTNGPASRDMLRQAGYPAAQLADGGALRYEYLFRHGRGRHVPRTVADGPRRILVILPMVPWQASSCLHALLRCFPRPALDDEGHQPAELIVKCHPILPIEKVMTGRTTLPAWFRIVKDPLPTLLNHAEVVLYAPPTTTRWEAYLAGLPVLKYCSDWLDMDTYTMDGFDGRTVTACSAETIRAALVSALTSPPDGFDGSTRREVLERILSPVNESVWRSALERATGEEGSHRVSLDANLAGEG